MTTRIFFLIGAALGVGYGLGFLLVPAALLKMYGSAAEPGTIVMARYFGVALLGFGLWGWALKDTKNAALIEALLLGHGISDVAGVLVSAWAAETGAINGLGWMNVALYTALLLICLYLYRGLSKVTARLIA